MRRMLNALLLLAVINMAHSRFIHRDGVRSERVVTVYDRNCFFSPIGCHFLHGRRAMTFITPSEVEEQNSFSESFTRNSTPTQSSFPSSFCQP